jgi:hypothetical protein
MNARLLCLFVLVLGAIIAACTANETQADATRDGGRPADATRDAEVDAMKSDAERQVDRFRAAAHRICREICECGRVPPRDSGDTYCRTGSNECCTNESFIEEYGDCEFAYFEEFTFMAGLCAERHENPIAREACTCEALEYCLTWAERTQCPADAKPLETIIKHPWICFGHNTEDRNFCCDIQQSTCTFLEQNQ